MIITDISLNLKKPVSVHHPGSWHSAYKQISFIYTVLYERENTCLWEHAERCCYHNVLYFVVDILKSNLHWISFLCVKHYFTHTCNFNIPLLQVGKDIGLNIKKQLYNDLFLVELNWRSSCCRDLLKQHRVRLHINFFASLILSGVANIMWFVLVHHDVLVNPVTTKNTLSTNPVRSCSVKTGSF